MPVEALDQGLTVQKGMVNSFDRKRQKKNGIKDRISGYINGNGFVNGNGFINGNGFVNGSGFINGNSFKNGDLLKPYKIRIRRIAIRRRIAVATCLAFFVFIVPYYMLIQNTFQIKGIVIDGKFEDWDQIYGFSDEVLDSPNACVDIIKYKFSRDREGIYVYLKTRGTILQGTDIDKERAYADIVRIFIGHVTSPTPIPQDNTIWEWVCEVTGYGNEIYSIDLYRATEDGKWQLASVPTSGSINGNEMELAIFFGKNLPKNPLFYVITQDYFGNIDEGRYAVVFDHAILDININGPRGIVIDKGVKMAVFGIINMTSYVMDTEITSLGFRVNGTTIFDRIRIHMYLDSDEDGWFDPLYDNELFGIYSLPNSDNIVRYIFDHPLYLEKGKKKTIFLVVQYDDIGDGGGGIYVLTPNWIEVIGERLYIGNLEFPCSVGFYVKVPTSITIDGMFEDWDQIGAFSDNVGDVPLPQIDLRHMKSTKGEGNIYLYMDVYANLLAGGQKSPIKIIRRGAPSTGQGQGGGLVGVGSFRLLNILPQEDTILVFIDSDRSINSGYNVDIPIGAEYLVKITGHDGIITSSKLYKYTQMTDEKWSPLVTIEAAKDDRRIEMAVDMSLLDVQSTEDVYIYIQIVSWNYTVDSSNTPIASCFEATMELRTGFKEPDSFIIHSDGTIEDNSNLVDIVHGIKSGTRGWTDPNLDYLVITEIMINPVDIDPDGSGPLPSDDYTEWIELYYSASAPSDLYMAEFTITDMDGAIEMYFDPGDNRIRVRPGAFMYIELGALPDGTTDIDGDGTAETTYLELNLVRNEGDYAYDVERYQSGQNDPTKYEIDAITNENGGDSNYVHLGSAGWHNMGNRDGPQDKVNGYYGAGDGPDDLDNIFDQIYLLSTNDWPYAPEYVIDFVQWGDSSVINVTGVPEEEFGDADLAVEAGLWESPYHYIDVNYMADGYSLGRVWDGTQDLNPPSKGYQATWALYITPSHGDAWDLADGTAGNGQSDSGYLACANDQGTLRAGCNEWDATVFYTSAYEISNGNGPNEDSNGYGMAIATADLNGDVYADIIIGAPYADDTVNSLTDCGAVYIFYGSPTLTLGDLTPTNADVVIYGGGDSEYFGYSIDTCGNIDGGTGDDLIIGAPTDGTGAGRAYIFFDTTITSGASSLTVANADRIFYGESTGDKFGYAVAGGKDLNNDGIPDVIIGAPYADTLGKIDNGRVYVFSGGKYSVSYFNPQNEDIATPYETVTGSYTDTSAADGTYEILAEGNSGPPAQIIALGDDNDPDHVYYIGSIPAGGIYKLRIISYISTGTEAFHVGWSYAGVSGSTDALLSPDITRTSVGEDQWNLSLSGFKGTELYIHIRDVDRAGGDNTNGDGIITKLSIDYIEVEALYPDGYIDGYTDYAYFGSSLTMLNDVNNDGMDDIVVGAPGVDRAMVYWGRNTWPTSGSKTVFSHGLSITGDVTFDVNIDEPDEAFNHTKTHGQEGTTSIDTTNIMREYRIRVRVLWWWVTTHTINATYRFYLPDIPDDSNNFQASIYAYYSDTQAVNIHVFDYSTGTWVDTGSDIPASAYAWVTITLSTNNVDPYTNEVTIAFGDDESSTDGTADVLYVDYIEITYTWSQRLPADVTLCGYTGSDFGKCVANIGDVNGDGMEDLAVGAPAWHNNRGAVYIYYSTALDGTLWESEISGVFPDSECALNASWANATIFGAWDGDGFGTSVSSAGIFNNDGKVYIAIGAPYNDSVGTVDDRGAVYIIGPILSSGYTDKVMSFNRAKWRYFGAAGDLLGYALAFGDINGDGYDDVITGAPNHAEGSTIVGHLKVISAVPELKDILLPIATTAPIVYILRRKRYKVKGYG